MGGSQDAAPGSPSHLPHELPRSQKWGSRRDELERLRGTRLVAEGGLNFPRVARSPHGLFCSSPPCREALGRPLKNTLVSHLQVPPFTPGTVLFPNRREGNVRTELSLPSEAPGARPAVSVRTHGPTGSSLLFLTLGRRGSTLSSSAQLNVSRLQSHSSPSELWLSRDTLVALSVLLCDS